jgi:tRNA-dihydrouridine synthase C
MRRVYPQAQQAFDTLRLVHDAHQIDQWLADQQRLPTPV